MPNIKSAKKKVKQDKKRTALNEKYKKSVAKIVKSLNSKTKKLSADQIKGAYSIIDKAVKKNIIHKNKAARLKSKVSKLVARGK